MAKSKNSGGTAQAAAPVAEAPAKKKGYETMIIGVSKANKTKRDQLEKIATGLGCKPSALIWAAIDGIIAKPPATAPAGAAGTNVGSASGFWTVVTKDAKGKANGIKVVEVSTRGEVTQEDGGRTFLRFKKGDDKERNRAKNQAIRAAQNDAGLIGFKGDIVVEELEADVEADSDEDQVEGDEDVDTDEDEDTSDDE